MSFKLLKYAHKSAVGSFFSALAGICFFSFGFEFLAGTQTTLEFWLVGALFLLSGFIGVAAHYDAGRDLKE